MIHLRPSDYTRQPWKNGKGTTTELWRLEREGALLVRLSRASVVEDGPFSLFPGVERNLTVLTGPGFRLTGPGVDLPCAPLVPVAFPGDVAVTATGTGGRASDDFNVMTARSLPRPQVAVETDTTLPAGGLLALYALGPASVNGEGMEPGDLILTEDEARLTGRLLAVRLHP
ncbi:HutD family protein [Rhodobacter sp. SGA-6-6]|uniref:HutD/Ves family protein n=1 Tax=Rhodobacter sp. SGA-6-6 TaxID=2710882 RepID=UPI0013EE2359|nr:HutD family protein [Rhodobacter sp. SGA-6-6]NGM44106.1 HutD family protein [Rhodobacter sp. SGA-6-6]